MLTYVPATNEDITQFYGGVRESLKAICVKRDGVPVAFVGIALEPLQARFFAEYRDMTCAEIRKSWRAVLMAMRYVRESRRPVVSIADGAEGHKNLSRLGFVQRASDYYAWPS